MINGTYWDLPIIFLLIIMITKIASKKAKRDLSKNKKARAGK